MSTEYEKELLRQRQEYIQKYNEYNDKLKDIDNELKEIEQEKHLTNIDAYLEIVPEHTRTTCSDEHPVNEYRCDRCALLDVKKSQYWPEDLDVEIIVRRRE